MTRKGEAKLPPHPKPVRPALTPKEIALRIGDCEERAAHLMRMAAAMQSEAMQLYAEIAVMKRYRDAAWMLMHRGQD